MKLGLLLPAKADAKWKLAAQAGVRYCVTKVAPELTGKNPPWDIDVLRGVQREFAAAGITLYGLEGDQFDMNRIKRGLPGRDEDIARYCRMLRNMGELGIPLLCYNFMVGIGWARTKVDVPTRGGALTSRVDYRELANLPSVEPITEEQVWENYTYFLRNVLPVAEKAGVTMSMHPDDPPMSPLRGVGRILSRPEAFDRALCLVPSRASAITFCQANFMAMGADLPGLIDRWGKVGRIGFVHFRDIRRTEHGFEETFHDDGPSDMPALLKAYHAASFDGLIRTDHAPIMEGECNDSPGYAMIGHVFAIGYMRGIAQTAGIPLE